MLLLGANTEHFTGSTGHSIDQATSTSRVPYPHERKDLYNQVAQDATSPVFKRAIPAARQGFGPQPAMAASTKAGLKDNPAMSFVMLTDSQVVPPQHMLDDYEEMRKNKASKEAHSAANEASSDPKQTLFHQIESTTRLFEILSSRSDIDHPVCAECTDLLLSQLQSRLSASTKERDAYITFLKTLNNTLPSSSEISKAQASLASSKAAEAKAFSELLELEKEKAALDDEVATLETESLALDEEEQAFWRSRNSFALTLSAFQDDRDALNAAYDHDAQQLERLELTNVYNDTFCIYHDGPFATINGLRLGRLPPTLNVDWSEINAAWGTAALLLATVAEKLGFTFRGYRIKPMGSTSRIEKIEQGNSASRQSSSGRVTNSASNPNTHQESQQPKITPLDLFSSGDLPLGRMLLHRRLDAGMVAFLECLRQLCDFVEQSSHRVPHNSTLSINDRDAPARDTKVTKLKAPYSITKDRIGDPQKPALIASIKLGVSQDDSWTRACKYTLTCCKFLLACASNVGLSDRRRGGREEGD